MRARIHGGLDDMNHSEVWGIPRSTTQKFRFLFKDVFFRKRSWVNEVTAMGERSSMELTSLQCKMYAEYH